MKSSKHARVSSLIITLSPYRSQFHHEERHGVQIFVCLESPQIAVLFSFLHSKHRPAACAHIRHLSRYILSRSLFKFSREFHHDPRWWCWRAWRHWVFSDLSRLSPRGLKLIAIIASSYFAVSITSNPVHRGKKKQKLSAVEFHIPAFTIITQPKTRSDHQKFNLARLKEFRFS